MSFYHKKVIVEADDTYKPDIDDDTYQKWLADWSETCKPDSYILPDSLQLGDIITKEARQKMSMYLPGVTMLILSVPARYKTPNSLLEPYSWRFDVFDMKNTMLKFAEFYEDDLMDYCVIRDGQVIWQPSYDRHEVMVDKE